MGVKSAIMRAEWYDKSEHNACESIICNKVYRVEPNYQNSTQLDIQLKDDKRNFRVL